VNGWQITARNNCFQNAHLAVEEIEISSPHQPRPRSWTIVHRKKAVVIAPMTESGNLVLIRQERIPIQAAIWEMPAGQIDEGKIESEEVALRELREETGYDLADNGRLISLGHFFSSAGFTDECAELFLARPVRASANGHAPEESESILDCREFTAAEIARMISENEIRDANTLSVCARLAARGFISLAQS
jgi:8-oxo-dGTP pyrophosphatase MutT (NUDIX family)